MKFKKDTYSRTAFSYAKQVVSGKIPACWQLRAQCQRSLDDLTRSDLVFDQGAVDHVCNFTQALVHIKGRWDGQPVKLEPFQIWILACLFGFFRKSDGLRKHRNAFVLLPRKNGKSLLAAAIGLYMAFADGEAGAEVYCGASNRDQANEVFEPAKRMADRSPGFAEAFDVEIMAESIFSISGGSSFKRVIGKTKDGSSPHLAICDEAHQHKDATQVQAFRTGMGARSQPLLLIISTAGFDLAGICRVEQLDAEAVLSRATIDDSLFAAIWTLDAGDDWRDFATWAKANPNIGVSISVDFLREQHAKALQSPSNQAFARTKYLNEWVASANGWLNLADWAAAADPALNFHALKGRKAFLGVDLSTKQDLTAIVAVVPLDDGRRAVFPFVFAPEGAVDGSPNAPAYAGWVERGHLIKTEGTASSFVEAEAKLAELIEHFKIEMAVFDSWQSDALRQRFEANGLNASIWIANNRAEWTRAMDDFEADLKNGLIVHPANSVLDWCAANICAKSVGASRIPVKPTQEKKIDAMIATLMAFAASNVPAPEPIPEFNIFVLD